MRNQQQAILPADADRFRAFVTRWLGFEMDDEKLWSLTDILRHRLREKNCSADAYLDGLESAHPFSDELRTLAQELTINETSFFRNADQMRAFAETALPDRLAAQSATRRLRILSAGCASGEEAYSLAMIIHNTPTAQAYDIDIVGIDADTKVLKKAAAARYSSWSLRQTPVQYRTDFFRAEKQEFVLADKIRKRVTYQERNLVLDDSDFWAPGSFDIVFCRHVIMYFAQDVARAVVTRMAQSLAPGGFLFLGTAETLRNLSDDFDLRHTHGTFYYQRCAQTTPRNRPSEKWDAVVVDAVPEGFVDVIGGATKRIQSLQTARARTSSAGNKTNTKAKKKAPVDLYPVIELLRCERASEALAMLEELPAEDRNSQQVLLFTAILLTHGGDIGRAERVCTEILARDAGDAGAHYVMALCRENSGDDAGAMQCDRQAARLDPTFAMPHVHMGLLARRANDWAAARAALSKAATLIQGEDASRLLLFGGGFGREALLGLCRAQLTACGGRQ